MSRPRRKDSSKLNIHPTIERTLNQPFTGGTLPVYIVTFTTTIEHPPVLTAYPAQAIDERYKVVLAEIIDDKEAFPL